MRFKLTAKENYNTGELGWLDSRIPRGSEVFEPMDYGYGLAHDCLEHTAFESVADEIEAHGAMYWVRYEGGWSHPENGFSLNMDSFAGEWINLYNGLQLESYLPVPPRTRSLDSCVESDISEIIELGSFMVRNEYPDCGHDVERIAEVFRAYFRIGYRKAVKRYKGQPACNIGALYNELAESIKRFKPEYEGQEIAIRVNVKACTVSVEEVFQEAY